MSKPFTAWVVWEDGTSEQYPYHFGTIRSIANELVEDVFRTWRPNDGPKKRVELRRGAYTIDTYSRTGWSSK